MFEKYNSILSGFLSNNCQCFHLLVSDELVSLLARSRVGKYRTKPREVIEIYEKLLKERCLS